MQDETTGAAIIVDFLVDAGVPFLFGRRDSLAAPLTEAARRREDRIRIVATRDDCTAAFMADAYCRLTRQPVAVVTPDAIRSGGAAPALASAMAGSSAVFAITGHAPDRAIDSGVPPGRECDDAADAVGAMRRCAKESFRASRADALPLLLRRAWSTMLSGRPGPVGLDVPQEVLAQRAPLDSGADAQDVPHGLKSQGDPDAITAAVALLLRAERPLILAGHGCTVGGAGSALVELVELLGVPIATTTRGKGVIDESHRLCLGPAGRDGTEPANRAMRGCDVLLALGTDLGDVGATDAISDAPRGPVQRRLVHVDVDPAAIGRVLAATVGIVGDAGLVIGQLVEALGAWTDTRRAPIDAWLKGTWDWKREWYAAIAQAGGPDDAPPDPDHLIVTLQAVAPADSIVLSDAGDFRSRIVQAWRVPRQGRLLQSAGPGSMGFGVAGALGARLAAPERPVIAVVSDVALLMHASAVATAVERDLPVVWVVCSSVADEALPVDVPGLARALGAQGEMVRRAGDLPEQLDAAIASRAPVVLALRAQVA